MTAKVLLPQPARNVIPLVEPGTRLLTVAWTQYFASLEDVTRLLNTNVLGPMSNAANDTAAAAAGVPIGGLYRNGNTVLIRLT